MRSRRHKKTYNAVNLSVKFYYRPTTVMNFPQGAGSNQRTGLTQTNILIYIWNILKEILINVFNWWHKEHFGKLQDTLTRI